ncbi:hypothetical protein MKW98_031060 [Papaver atlanticum]|uniref:DUF7788 domain-containing protein n=1 Tax=Papaver atlanticum TaxID=357466 RepID=A0AAD4SV07_9MAGN|nr:hypothetical protein MKW98_031060 [Papaver atlanticum]
MLKIGKLNNCLAICDLSGSKSGTPVEVSVALGLLISESSEDPWKGKLKEHQKIKRLFVFSDIEFNQASRKQRYQNNEVPENEWETDYGVIQQKFRAKGYRKVPEILFWNL